MLNDASVFIKAIIAVGYTDLRRGIEGLATTVKSKYHFDPHEKNILFLFCESRSDRIKGLIWEGDGFLLLYKRLDAGSFSWPKANNLNVYEYIKYLLAEIPEHMNDTNTEFCKKLLPWSDSLPAECKKKM